MNEDHKYEIAVLADDYESKRQRFEMLGLINTQGKTAEERTKMSIEYHQADADVRQAWTRLETAKRQIAAGR
jgi:hypothetical protein